MSQELLDRLAIRDLVENWAIRRDAGDWERFSTIWHDDGVVQATWFQGAADEFVEVSRTAFEKGVSILHFLGGTSVDLNDNRAVGKPITDTVGIDLSRQALNPGR